MSIDMFVQMARELASASPPSRSLVPPADALNMVMNQAQALNQPSKTAQADAYAQQKLGIATVAAPIPRPVELNPNFTAPEVEAVIRACYKQVFGNTYILESDRLTQAESLLRNKSVSVREFVRLLAKSDLYKERFFFTTNNNRFIELNCKHLLGRAPYNQGEIATHFDLYSSKGYDADIDSYIDSDEYRESFGESIVPYFRGFKYQTSQSAAAFPRLLKLYGGDAGSDTDRTKEGQQAELITDLAKPKPPIEVRSLPPTKFAAPAFKRPESMPGLNAWVDMARDLAQSGTYLRRLPTVGQGLQKYKDLLLPATIAQSDAAAQQKLGIGSVATTNPNVVELNPNFTEDELQVVIRAAYKQVFGNTYILESNRLTQAESLLRNQSISVREFVRRLAKSDLYKERFFYNTFNNRFVEFNLKHLLGRALYSQVEIAEHLDRYQASGYDTEIDSYIDSDEYRESFGESIVPYFRGFKYQTSQSAAAFPRLLKLYGGDAGSDIDPTTNRQAGLAQWVALIRELPKFDQQFKGYENLLAPAVDAQSEAYGQQKLGIGSVATPTIVELNPSFTENELQVVIRAAYKQVFGNTYILESDRLTQAESLLRNKSVSVREFVRLLAKSDLYKERFFFVTNNNRFIELNFKHLLGRAPYGQSEIVEHLDRYQTTGYDTDIDSYIDSDEYRESFGENIVPYFRGFRYQVNQSGPAFEHLLKLYSGDAGSDTDRSRQGQRAALIPDLAEPAATTQKRTNIQSATLPTAVELNPNFSEAELQVVIRAAYKQVFGNTYILESDRLTQAESLLRNKSVSVREFVRLLAKSDLYKERFFFVTNNNRFIELNFKHLLGRAPYGQSEIVEHLDRYQTTGYDTDIDSYIDSEEYRESFGENIVPYFRGFKSQPNQTTAAFGRMLKLYGGDAGSDTDRNRQGQRAELITDLGTKSVVEVDKSPSLSVSFDQVKNLFSQPEAYGQQKLGITSVAVPTIVELNPNFSEAELQIVIRAAYKQVFGNTYILESERLVQTESLLRNQSISAREFVRRLAKSDLYKERFFFATNNNRFIELNFKHLLGRAPYDQAEISEHVSRCISLGYDTEIDSYLDSEEYRESFGENIVPYLRGFKSQLNQPTAVFPRLLKLYGGDAGSDTDRNQAGQRAELITDLGKPDSPGDVGLNPALSVYFDQASFSYTQSEAYGQQRLGIGSVATPTVVELNPNFTEAELQVVIRAAYKQVFGNTYILESDSLIQAESLLRNKSVSVREFVRLLAKSDLYKERFFFVTNNNRFIELNFKHLLGRAPYGQSEIVEHLDRYQTTGYDTDIDSYIDSEEYRESFGENIVPYFRGFKSRPNQPTAVFPRLLKLYGGDAGSDTDRNRQGQRAELITNLATKTRPSTQVDGSLQAQAVALSRFVQPSEWQGWLNGALSAQIEAYGLQKLGIASVAVPTIVELNPNFTEAELQVVIRAVYKQVFGNTYILESERLTQAESLLRNKSVSVREFVRLLAKSDLYKERFFSATNNNRFIELNFKHLLGRAPYSQAEISEHVDRCISSGYDSEVDSYIDSEEYRESFGENIVPYFRGFKSQPNQPAAVFPRLLKLYGGDAGSDTDRNRQGQRAELITDLAAEPKPLAEVEQTPSTLSYFNRIGLSFPQSEAYSQQKLGIASVAAPTVVELNPNFTEDELQVVIRAAYKQVFGNTYILESERLTQAESLLRNRSVSVREFVRLLAKSDLYKDRFFSRTNNNRFIELNFKHLLGRAPYSQIEVSEHVDRCISSGYDTDIDSYIDSDEYRENFGENIVPYLRGFKSQLNQPTAVFPRLLKLYGGDAGSDTDRNRQGQHSALITDLAQTKPQKAESLDPSVSSYYLKPEDLSRPSSHAQSEAHGQQKLGIASATALTLVELNPNFSEAELQSVIRAAYKQVFGNTYILESERLVQTESLLRNQSISVREFVRRLAKSDLYKERFFFATNNNRFIELNLKHLLGRAPYSQIEVSEHVDRCISSGYDTDIDSYIDSDEYRENFGENIVPYLRGFKSQPNQPTAVFPRLLKLYGGDASSDTDRNRQGQRAELITDLGKPKPPIEVKKLTNSVYLGQEGYFTEPATSARPEAYGQQKLGIASAAMPTIVELNPYFTEDELQVVIRAAYKQIFGNTYILESERLTQAESLLRNRAMSVREFVRLLAKSDLYKERFFFATNNNRFIELNFKHLLGRAPYSQSEIVEHLDRYQTTGYDCDIDSYIDSDEYRESFGENIVPYFRGFKSQPSQTVAAFGRMLKLYGGDAGSDTDRAWDGQLRQVAPDELLQSGREII